MKRVACLVLLYVAAIPIVAAPVPPEKKETGPMEIDFSPLAKATAPKFVLTVTVTSEDDHQTKVPCATQGNPGAITMTRTVQDSLPAGWDTSLDQTMTKLTIKSYKGSPVKSVEITLEGEKKELTSTVKRLKPVDKKEDKK